MDVVTAAALLQRLQGHYLIYAEQRKELIASGFSFLLSNLFLSRSLPLILSLPCLLLNGNP